MKTKFHYVWVALYMFVSICAAQTTADTKGIPIQGLSRTTSGEVNKSTKITLTLQLYYLVNSSQYQFLSRVVDLETDEFGVFSYVLSVGNEYETTFSNHKTYLRIKENNVTISDEALKTAPYAIAAANGMPTGTIMPFVGTVVPSGWVLCNGQSLNAITGSQALVALLGENTVPDLQGMFLRGTGTSTANSQDGPALGATQNEAIKAHTHAAYGSSSSHLSTNSTGSHTHNDGEYKYFVKADGSGTQRESDNSSSEPDIVHSAATKTTGNHHHTISGSVANAGGTETRPVNYGVNYIIKL